MAPCYKTLLWKIETLELPVAENPHTHYDGPATDSCSDLHELLIKIQRWQDQALLLFF